MCDHHNSGREAERVSVIAFAAFVFAIGVGVGLVAQPKRVHDRASHAELLRAGLLGGDLPQVAAILDPDILGWERTDGSIDRMTWDLAWDIWAEMDEAQRRADTLYNRPDLIGDPEYVDIWTEHHRYSPDCEE